MIPMFKAFAYPLHTAAEHGDVARLASLLAHGADVDRRDRVGCTPLMYAARSGRLDAARRLLKAGACIEWQASDGSSALTFAVASGQTAMVQLLLAHGANPNQAISAQPIMANADTRKRIYKMRDSNPQISAAAADELIAVLEAPRSGVPSALASAAIHGHDEIVIALLDAGADPNAASSLYGATPLQYAVQRRHVSTVQLLLDRGADVEFASRNTLTALQSVASTKCQEIARTLLEAGANPNAGEVQPLVFAITNHDLAMIDLLLQFGANPDLLLKTGAPISELAFDKPEIQAIFARYKKADR